MNKAFTRAGMAVMVIITLLFLTGCPNNDKDDNNNGTNSENGVNHQFGDGFTIPPDLGRILEEGSGWQNSGGESSGDGFSITIEGDDIIIIGEQTVEVDLDNPGTHHGSFNSSNNSGDENGKGE
jgi:hypothetical protein